MGVRVITHTANTVTPILYCYSHTSFTQVHVHTVNTIINVQVHDCYSSTEKPVYSGHPWGQTNSGCNKEVAC